jgi:hypothetical protein
MADQLCAPEDLASLLEMDLDAYKATMLVEAGTAVVQATVGRPPQRIVEVTDDEVTLMGTTAAWLHLPQRPVSAVSSVNIDDADDDLVEGTDFKRFGSRLWRACGWAICWTEPSTVVVTYTHGYPEGDQGLQLARGAVIALIKGVYDNPTGATQVRIDDYSAAYAALSAQMDASPFLAANLRRQYGAGVGLAAVGGI